jgi:hypothetical protein
MGDASLSDRPATDLGEVLGDASAAGVGDG